jgi:hypothetical protein
MIKADFFNLDNTLDEFMKMKQAAVDAMIDCGLRQVK